MKKNKYLLAIISILLITYFCIYRLNFLDSNSDIYISEFNYKINYAKNYIKLSKNIIINSFNDRFVEVNDKNNTIIIGSSKKEIENGYYDIKISIYDNNVNIHLNKLFKNIYDINNICDSSYIEEVINLLNLIFNLNFNSSEKIILKEYISRNYQNIRCEYVETVENSKEIILKSFNVKSHIEKNILIIEIRG